MTSTSTHQYLCRKWIGVVWLALEVAFVSGSIFGFSSIFKVLSKDGVYDSHCKTVMIKNTTTAKVYTERNCDEQTKKYEVALTLGIIFFNLPSVFMGPLVDLFGARFVKLIAIILYIIGWLALALVRPGHDYLLIIHTVFTSFSGFVILITAFASAGYFSESRAFVSTIFTSGNITGTIWYAIFQILINANILTLRQLSYIWTSLAFFLLVSSFLFLDWKFPILNLPYKFDVNLEDLSTKNKELSENMNISETNTESKWYSKLINRSGIWAHITNPLYVMVVLFLSVLLLPIDLLSITWYSRVYYLTNQNISTANKYANAFNFSILVGIIVCPFSGFLIDYKANQNRKRKLLNILIVQTITWILSITSCVICAFITRAVIIPSLVLNCITRSMVVAGPQAVVTTFFPSKYIGTLTGIMWTMVGGIGFVQYGLIELTQDVTKSWKAWLIVLGMVIIMLSHLIQLCFIYHREKVDQVVDIQSLEIKNTNAELFNDQIKNEKKSKISTEDQQILTKF